MTCECGRPGRHHGRTLCHACYERLRRNGQLVKLPTLSIEQRFFEKVDAADALDCWRWTGALNECGYGAFKGTHGRVAAHRWSYQFLIGEVPDGLQLDHLCRVRHCVNPWHLEPVTARVNLARGESPSAVAARTGVCGRGHVGEWVSGRTQCRACQREHYARRAADPEWRRHRNARVAARAKVLRANRVHTPPDTAEAQSEHLRRIGDDR